MTEKSCSLSKEQESLKEIDIIETERTVQEHPDILTFQNEGPAREQQMKYEQQLGHAASAVEAAAREQAKVREDFESDKNIVENRQFMKLDSFQSMLGKDLLKLERMGCP